MKIRIPFRMFGGQEGSIELDIPIDTSMNARDERDEERIRKYASKIAAILGVFRDEFQHEILGYERCPGIGNVFETLRFCDEDDILRERILELTREGFQKRFHKDVEENE